MGGQITQSRNTARVITYQFGLSAGQTVSPGSYLFDAQMSATRTAHPTRGDTFTVTYTRVGQTFTRDRTLLIAFSAAGRRKAGSRAF